MNYILHFFLFVIIFVLYINFYRQNSHCDISQIYELEYVNNHSLQTNCELNQPAVFEFYMDPIEETNNTIIIQNTTNNDSVALQDLPTYLKSQTIPVFSTQNFISSINESYIDIQPPTSFFAGHNIICGSQNATTKSYIHNYYRKFLYISEGSIEITFATYNKTPKNKIKSDFVNYEFCIEQDISDIGESCIVEKGHVVYIPANCVYSMKFLQDSNICVDYSFHSFVSGISNAHKQAIYWMQQYNVYETPNELKKYEIKNNVQDNDVDNSNVINATNETNINEESVIEEPIDLT